MKVRKLIGKPLDIINVSREVYDIFDTTGFTELFNVKKAFRRVSVEGCEEIGRGTHGIVYRLDAETIIKVYYDDSTLSLIEKEREYSKKAFVSGVPSAIAYDLVRTEKGYGLVYEMAGAVTASKMISENPDRLPEFAVKLGKLLKTLNTTEADPKIFGSIKELYLERQKISAEYLTPEENAQLIRMIEAVPDGSGMIHGDFHPNNVMVQSDGELVLVDMANIGRGDPLFDIGGAFLTMYLIGARQPEKTKEIIGLEYELSKKVWGIMLSTYYNTTDQKKLELIGQRCGAFALMRMADVIGLGVKQTNDGAEGMKAVLRQQLFPNTENFCKLFSMQI